MTNPGGWWDIWPGWRELLFPTKEPQFPYVEECNVCTGIGYKSFMWWQNMYENSCDECKGRGYIIPPEWTEEC